MLGYLSSSYKSALGTPLWEEHYLARFGLHYNGMTVTGEISLTMSMRTQVQTRMMIVKVFLFLLESYSLLCEYCECVSKVF